MIDRKRCCIVVQVYKKFEDYNKNEQASLLQMLKVFGGSRDIFFMCPERLVEDYKKFSTCIVLPDRFFTYAGYNDLCKSPDFYQIFLDQGYQYFCLTQLDVWIFQDNLEYFLSEFDKNEYDYIGAPWYGVHFCKDGTVGNGGFCIRRLEKFRDLCAEGRRGGNEDVALILCSGNKLKIAPEKLALEFSFEEKPLHAFRLNNLKLPMGCHAYASTPDRIGFWKHFICPIYEIKCKAGNPDIYNP